MLIRRCLWLAPLLIFAALAAAEDSKDKNSKNADKTDDPVAREAAFDELQKKWKGLIAELTTLRHEHARALDADRPAIVKKFETKRNEAARLAPQLERAALEAYRAAPNTDIEVTEFLFVLLRDKVDGDDCETADEISRLLIENRADKADLRRIKQPVVVYRLAGRAAYCLGDWDRAADYLRKADAERVMAGDEDAENYLKVVNDEKTRRRFLADWAAEQKIRAAEAKADDLPRVKLQTNRGDIVLELFENEAPNTVANFISLVENGSYNDVAISQVFKHRAALSDRVSDVRYTIDCECDEDHARKHFRGSLTMSHGGRNTGSSQFLLTFLPIRNWDGQHTVFGRVIEGIDVLSRLRRTGPRFAGEPDKIVKATVLRKRDHKYEPKVRKLPTPPPAKKQPAKKDPTTIKPEKK